MNHKIENDQIAGTLSAHREFFSTHITKEYAFRIDNLVKLKKAISRYEKKLSESLKKDLNKSPFEAYITEIGFVQE
ncbi:MAG TPA: aldehyde dehydrogenase, partial [Spirochaetota bacterium]|nr:aldehyde dehydrogenase [Spirochaetota bacterium]